MGALSFEAAGSWRVHLQSFVIDIYYKRNAGKDSGKL